jgi:hypothetical protein
MHHGQQLGVRWDYAFYQMIVETGWLSFTSGTRGHEVKPAQNNFAGLGASGGVPGESFKDVATGVRAHLLLYPGDRIESPVAERTRKVQGVGVLTKWQSQFQRPVTFGDLAEQWAPGGAYRLGLATTAAGFAEICRASDLHAGPADHCLRPSATPPVDGRQGALAGDKHTRP